MKNFSGVVCLEESEGRCHRELHLSLEMFSQVHQTLKMSLKYLQTLPSGREGKWKGVAISNYTPRSHEILFQVIDTAFSVQSVSPARQGFAPPLHQCYLLDGVSC